MLDKLSELRAFQAVAESGSFTAAAAELRMSQSLVSRAVARLERRLGASLLHRSTRHVALTENGVAFLHWCRRVLEDAGEAERSVTSNEQPAGTLRISASVLVGQDPIVPLLPEFLAHYPKLNVQFLLADRYVDLIEERIDVAIRLGHLADSSLIARKIGEMRRVIVASPSYLAQHGRPTTPDSLLDHNCLLWDEQNDRLNQWPFEVDGMIHHIKVRGRMTVNNAQTLYQLVVMGVGISRMTEHWALPFIRRGELVPLLEGLHHDEATPVHAVYVKTNLVRPKVRAFLDFLSGRLLISH